MMTTEPFSPPSNTDPFEGSAPIAPVTLEMMDHAARTAAERADAVAHDVPEPVPAATDPVARQLSEAAREAHDDAPALASEPVVPAPAAEAPPTEAAPTTPQAAPHARAATAWMIEEAERAGAGPIDSVGRYTAKVLEIATANMSAAGELVSALLEATSLSEAAAINAEHMRRRLDVLTTQGRDLMLLAQAVAFDAMRPSSDDLREP